jgi:hypothetical protein
MAEGFGLDVGGHSHVSTYSVHVTTLHSLPDAPLPVVLPRLHCQPQNRPWVALLTPAIDHMGQQEKTACRPVRRRLPQFQETLELELEPRWT